MAKQTRKPRAAPSIARFRRLGFYELTSDSCHSFRLYLPFQFFFNVSFALQFELLWVFILICYFLFDPTRHLFRNNDEQWKLSSVALWFLKHPQLFLSKHHKSPRQVQIEFRIDFAIHLRFVCVILEKVLIETSLSKLFWRVIYRDKKQSSTLSSSLLLILVCPCQTTVNYCFGGLSRPRIRSRRPSKFGSFIQIIHSEFSPLLDQIYCNRQKILNTKKGLPLSIKRAIENPPAENHLWLTRKFKEKKQSLKRKRSDRGTVSRI